jgi:sugar lactone lactonase YvrE
MNPEPVTEPGAKLGEGPLWDVAAQRLLWLDIYAGTVYELDPATGAQRSWTVGGLVGSLALAADGRLVLGIDGRLVTLDRDSGEVEALAQLSSDPDVRCNDGGVDPQGRLLVGTMSISGVEGAAALYRLERDGQVTQLLAGVTISNGLGWDETGERLMHIDTHTGRLTAYRYGDGAPLKPIGEAIDAGAGPGVPDGMAIDADGRLWIAFWGGHEVRCFEQDGTELERLRLPAHYVTSCAFGGASLDELYVTTARWDRSAVDEPLAGAVFRLRPGVVGRPPALAQTP